MDHDMVVCVKSFGYRILKFFTGSLRILFTDFRLKPFNPFLNNTGSIAFVEFCKAKCHFYLPLSDIKPLVEPAKQMAGKPNPDLQDPDFLLMGLFSSCQLIDHAME